MLSKPRAETFRNLMFANVLPDIGKIGLLDGFLEQKYAEMGILGLRNFDADGLPRSYIGGENSLAADRQRAEAWFPVQAEDSSSKLAVPNFIALYPRPSAV